VVPTAALLFLEPFSLCIPWEPRTPHSSRAGALAPCASSIAHSALLAARGAAVHSRALQRTAAAAPRAAFLFRSDSSGVSAGHLPACQGPCHHGPWPHYTSTHHSLTHCVELQQLRMVPVRPLALPPAWDLSLRPWTPSLVARTIWLTLRAAHSKPNSGVRSPTAGVHSL
jgi:hypothetical protein